MQGMVKGCYKVYGCQGASLQSPRVFVDALHLRILLSLLVPSV